MAEGGLQAPYKKLLVTIYCNTLKGTKSAPSKLAEQLKVSLGYVKEVCGELEREGLIKKVGREYRFTEAGRGKINVVLAGGVFDIIHPGHIHTLEASRELGDVLIVSVARNKTILKNRGRGPLNDERLRSEMVGSLRMVDLALLGSKEDIFETVLRVEPDIIALGYDQKHSEEGLVKRAKRSGLSLRVVRLGSPIPDIKSSKIREDQEILKSL